jgi:signal transduction histidine kinase
MLTSTTRASPPSIEVLQRTDELALAGRLVLELMHEINNPLDALASLAYLALEESDDPEQVRAYLHQIDEQVAILRQIVGQTLGLARSSPIRKEQKLRELAEAAVRIHRKTIEGNQIHLVREIPEDE